MQHAEPKLGTCPTDNEARTVRERVTEIGTDTVASLLQVSRETVARLAAGLPIRRASLALVRARWSHLGVPQAPTAA